MTLYTHRPLSSRNSIRVLELQPGQPGDTLRGKLIEVRLSEDTIFDALSYCWGEPKFDRHFICDDEKYQITESLAIALEHIRKTEESLTIWIDQLSIDQNNVDERNNQVQMMGRIFSSARQVLIWLGQSSEASDYLFKCIRTYKFTNSDLQRLMYAVVELYDRPWFERTWTVQEFVLAKRTQLMVCGHQGSEWSRFVSFTHMLYTRISLQDPEKYPDPTPSMLEDIRDICRRLAYLPTKTIFEHVFTTTSVDSNPVWKKFVSFPSMKFMQRETSARSLSKLLIWTHKRQTTDPRDKVFGLLGICKFRDEPIRVDYARTAESLYTEVMARMIVDESEIAFMGFSFGLLHTSRVGKLPSWVPDLSNQSDTEPLELTRDRKRVRAHADCIRQAIASSTGSKPIATFSCNFQTLFTKGRKLGMIVHVLRPNPEGLTYGGWKRWLSWVMPLARAQHCLPEEILLSLCDHRSRRTRVEDGKFIALLSKITKYVENTALAPWTDDLDIVSPLEFLQTFVDERCFKNFFFVMDTGHIGRCIGRFEREVEIGDVVAGLFEIDLPFVLRRKDDAHTMVSMAHVAGHRYRERHHDETASVNASKEDVLREYSIV
ncbi:heterokaryon incompatibility protein-domain-containing protein [Paraphoma chrysanthemicola]|nr:heterokaryon incompatibility protein-domain-containing protein [Paraphoma chrysanthemicola]